MTLFEKIEEAILLGYSVNFSSDIGQLLVTVEKNKTKKVSALPLSDHFYEQRVVDCIEWSIKTIEENALS